MGTYDGENEEREDQEGQETTARADTCHKFAAELRDYFTFKSGVFEQKKRLFT